MVCDLSVEYIGAGLEMIAKVAVRGAEEKRGSAILQYAILLAVTVPVLMLVLWPHPGNAMYETLRNVHRRAVIVICTPGL